MKTRDDTSSAPLQYLFYPWGKEPKDVKGCLLTVWSSSEFKKIYFFLKNSPKTLNFLQFHLCFAYCNQFKTLRTFPITPCRYFPSSPQSSAIGNQHSHIPWQAKKYFLLNQLAAALVRLVFLHLITYNLCSWKFSLEKQLQIFFATHPSLHQQCLSDPKGYHN